MAKARYHYNVMLRPEPAGGYTALVPALPGCVTYGRTLKEARELAKAARVNDFETHEPRDY